MCELCHPNPTSGSARDRHVMVVSVSGCRFPLGRSFVFARELQCWNLRACACFDNSKAAGTICPQVAATMPRGAYLALVAVLLAHASTTTALPNLHIIGTAGPHAPVPSPGGVTYASLNVTSKVFTAIKSYGPLADFATTAVFQKGQFVTFDTVYTKQGVPSYRFIRMQPDGR